MDVAATIRFIEGVTPVLDDVFPDWPREHREALTIRLVLVIDEYERDARLEGPSTGSSALPRD